MAKQVEAAEAPRRIVPGLLRAMSRVAVRSTCAGCGFPMPVYPGRYPKTCPVCGKAREGVGLPANEPKAELADG